MIKLQHPIIGVKEFDDDHAKRILARTRTGGWVEFKEDEQGTDAADNSRNKGNTEGADKGKGGNSKSKTSGK